jgi:thiol-disulfide isomerase/thioredoxin
MPGTLPRFRSPSFRCSVPRVLIGRQRRRRPCRVLTAEARRARPIAVLACLGILTACQSGSTLGAGATNSTGIIGVTTYPVHDRRAAPALAGETLDGRAWSLASQDRGHIVVINVWASWCGPCRGELPTLASAAKRLGPDDGVRFVGLDEADRASDARAFVASTGITYPSLVDSSGSLLRELRLLPQAGVPSTLVLDTHGRMAARVIGAITAIELDKIVRGLRVEA